MRVDAPAGDTDLIDLAQAAEFLALLDESAGAWTFQTFDDDKRRKDKRLAQIINAPLEDAAEELSALSRRGAGVFVTVNETDGKGRKVANIRRIRAVWHEDDEGVPRAFPLAPSIQVASSAGKFHRYWLVEDDLTTCQFRGVMNTLVEDYGSDPNAKDLARVMRLPGFPNQKTAYAAPFVVRLLDSGPTYTAAEIVAAFPERERSAGGATPLPTGGQTLAPARVQEIRGALSFVRPDSRETWLEVGMALHATGAGDQAFGLWDEWSRLTDARNYDPEDQRRVWHSFGRHPGPQLGLGRLFALAQAGGWVNPKKRIRADADEAPDIEDTREENERRLAFEQQINDTEDFAELVYQIAPAVRRAELREPSRAVLLKLISSKTKVGLKLLQPAAEPKHRERSAPPDAAGGEDPKLFMPELNARHAVVPSGGRVQILNEETDMELGRRVLTFSSRTDFVLLYENRTLWVDGEAVDIGSYWLRSPERRQYEGLAFAPGRDIGGYYNTFQGWALEPDPRGSCERFKAFMQEVICAGDAEAYAYVWRWLAHLFQKPWEIPETALVLRSRPGAGKNTFVGPIGRLLGAHYLELSHVDQMVGRFSAHMADKLLVFANEALWGGDKSAEGTFKALVTDKQSAIEGKHRDIVARANYKRVIIASNEGWAAPKGPRDRRLVTLDVPPVRCGDRAYFDAIRLELRRGGARRLLYELLATDLADYRTQEIPQQLKEAGWDMAVASMDTVAAWWMELLEQGYIVMRGDDEYSTASRYVWPESVVSEHLHGMYIKWCERHRRLHPLERSRFGHALKKFGIERKKGGRKREASGAVERPWVYFLRPLAESRRLLAQEYDLPDTVWGAAENA